MQEPPTLAKFAHHYGLSGRLYLLMGREPTPLNGGFERIGPEKEGYRMSGFLRLRECSPSSMIVSPILIAAGRMISEKSTRS